MCDYGKLTDEPCENQWGVSVGIHDKNVELCNVHAGILIENLITSTCLNGTDKADLLIEIIYGEL